MRLRITGLPSAAGCLALPAFRWVAVILGVPVVLVLLATVFVGRPAASARLAPAGTQAVREACPPPASRLMEQCQLLVAAVVGTVRPKVAQGELSAVAGDAVTGPLRPDDLRAAYGLAQAAKAGGRGETVAVVEAYQDPYAVSDFDRYRQMNNLPACAPATGAGCLTVLNEGGRRWPLPAGSAAGWEDEAALDTEMVAAICPNCRVALFEASSASLTDLGTAENSAARVARFISDSWTGPDFPGESQFDPRYFNHPGVAITVASGDAGYDAGYPASSQLVTSVGGTYLDVAGGGLDVAGASLDVAGGGRRGWTEVAWSGQSTGRGTGTQSGCSSGEPKPAWQSDPGCANRTETDVAAVADAPAGVAFYSSSADCGGVCKGYGTSVAAPVIAAVYALAGPPRAGTYPAEYPYLDPAGLHRVTSGADGSCEVGRRYLCDDAYSLGDGYNGPDGLGTPDGTAAFAPPSRGTIVSVINPGTYDLQAGLDYRLPAIRASDSGAGARLAFSATGLPAGLSISPSSGVISGRLRPAGPIEAAVRVTATDPSGATATVSFRIVGVRSLTGGYRGGQGEVALDLGRMCLDDRRNLARKGNPVQVWRCRNDRAQRWTFRPGSVPGGAGALLINGRCLDITGRARQAGSRVAIWPCTGYGNQQWLITGTGELYNPASGMCLDDPGGSRANGRPAVIAPCHGTREQAWALPASPITSGVTGRCMAGSGGARVVIFRCNGTSAQAFRLGLDSTIRTGGKCLNVAGGLADDGAPVRLQRCDGAPGEIFQASSFGMLQNPGSGKCLADPGNAVADGTQLVIDDCYGLPGEIWALS